MSRAQLDPWFDPKDLVSIAGYYCEPHQQRFPEVSPVFADLEIWPEMWHVFQMCVGRMPESRRAIRNIGEYVQTQLS